MTADLQQTVGSGVLQKNLGNSNTRNLGVSKPNNQNNNSQKITQTEQNREQKSTNIEKALPYISVGVSAASAAAAVTALVVGKKGQSNITKKIEQLEQQMISGGNGNGAPVKNTKEMASFVIGLVGAAAAGGAVANHFDTHKDDLKKMGLSDDEIANHKTKVENAVGQRDNKINKIENSVNDAVKRAQEAENKANNAENKANNAEGRVNHAVDTANEAISKVNSTNKSGLALKIHRKKWYDLNLMVVDNNEKYMNKQKIESAMQDIHTAVIYRIGRTNGQTQEIINNYRKKYVPKLKSNSTWAITAEFDPIKAGGLGSVPMEIQNNFTDMGIDNPVFIPMYQKKGKAEFFEYGDEKSGKKYKYVYGGDTFNLEKLAEMPVQQYRGDKVTNQNVEFYMGHPYRTGLDGKKFANMDQQLIFVKNNDNFAGDDLYSNNFNADETEKFAFLNKAIYQLAEAKVSESLGKNKTGVGEIKVIDKEAYDKLHTPVTMVLNDWHAAPMAGLLRYKAPMENAYNIIDDDVKNALRDMPLIMIGHNAGIPGSSRNDSIERSDMVTENIVNTLYDSFAYGIVENATTGSEYNSVDNSIVYEKENPQERQFNNLAHGISLSDYYIPVSKNYEKELKSGEQKSGMALNIIQRRSENDTITGIINGLDRELNSTEAKAKWLKDKFGIELKTYNHHTPIDEVMDARQHNKMEFYDKFFKPLMDGEPPKGGFKYQPIDGVADVSREDFENAPFIAFAHRLTEQKGLSMFADAVAEVYNTWDEKHPGKPKPVIMAGGDLEDPKQEPFLHALKDPKRYKNPDDIKRIQVLQGFMPNPSLYSAVTYFCAPSTFEPCGLTQGECYAQGTPIITTATGGFVDTITDGKNGFVSAYKPNHKDNAHNLAEKFNEGLDVFFNDKDKYKSIVKNNLNENLSWNQGKDDDAIHQYINRLGINKDDIIEADVAEVRTYMLPILQQFNKLQSGKMTQEDFEDKTNILDIAKDDTNARNKKDSVFNKYEAKNSSKDSKINQNIQTINQYIQNYTDIIDGKNKSDNKKGKTISVSSAKGKLETVNLKLGIEKDKLDTNNKSRAVFENDKKMFEQLVNAYATNRTNLKGDEYKELNEWKDGIISKYAA